MKEWSYTTALLIGVVLLLIAGLALTWVELLEYNKASGAATVGARHGAPVGAEATEGVETTPP